MRTIALVGSPWLPVATTTTLLGGKRFHFAGREQLVLADVQVAKFDGDLDVVDHGATHDADAPIMPAGDIDDLLHPAQIAGECRQQHPAFRLTEGAVEHGLYGALALRLALLLGVGAVGDEQQHALISPAAQFVRLGGLVIRRRGIEAIVAGVDDATGGRHAKRRLRYRGSCGMCGRTRR